MLRAFVDTRGKNQDVAWWLGVSVETVKSHIRSIRQKYGEPTVLGCVLEAVDRGDLSI